jgi:hypothetical protein
MVEVLEGRQLLSRAAVIHPLDLPPRVAVLPWPPVGVTPASTHPTLVPAHVVRRNPVLLVAGRHLGVVGRATPKYTPNHKLNVGDVLRTIVAAPIVIPVFGIAHLFGKGI